MTASFDTDTIQQPSLMELLGAAFDYELDRVVVPASSSSQAPLLLLSDVPLTPSQQPTLTSTLPSSAFSSRRQKLRSVIDAALQILDDDDDFLGQDHSVKLELESTSSQHTMA
mgnify:CR=1 FL=1